MTKEELIEFLKENLKVEVSTHQTRFCSQGCDVNVKLFLGDEVISEGYDSVTASMIEHTYP